MDARRAPAHILSIDPYGGKMDTKTVRNGEKSEHDQSGNDSHIEAAYEHGLVRRRRTNVMWLKVAFGILLLIASASFWLDPTNGVLKFCRYSKLCKGLLDDWVFAQDAPPSPQDPPKDPNQPPQIPQYVLDFAPFVYLDQDETYWPCDMAEHLTHTIPNLNYTPIAEMARTALNLSNLDQLNAWEKGRHVFLTSKDDVQERPPWLTGDVNVPNPFVKDGEGARSKAPAILITVEKDQGIVDAFWFFFYSFNRGNSVLGIRWGNHVGDWEHTLVRFQNGKPQLVFFSEHYAGSAYTYDAVEKIGKRPIVYSAIGTHAMYASSGSHPYILPLGLLRDATSRGPLWDPAQNIHSYTYAPSTDTLLASSLTPSSPIPWFYFNGHWGDKSYPLSDPRQYGLIGEYHYVSGPLGPRFKHLSRRKVCQGLDTDECRIRTSSNAGHEEEEEEIRIFPPIGEGEDWSEHEELRPPGLDY